MELSNIEKIEKLATSDKLRLYKSDKSHYCIEGKLNIRSYDNIRGASDQYSSITKAVRSKAKACIQDDLDRVYRHLAAVGVTSDNLAAYGYTSYTFKQMMNVAGFSL